jgi:hypothetical protein
MSLIFLRPTPPLFPSSRASGHTFYKETVNRLGCLWRGMSEIGVGGGGGNDETTFLLE